MTAKIQAATMTPRRDRLNWWIGAYLVLGTVAFIAFAWQIRGVPYFDFDDDLTRALQTYRTDWLNTVMYLISWIGFSPQAAIVAGLVNLFIFSRRYKLEAMVGLGAAVSIYAINTLLKELIYRPRPTLEQVYHIFVPLDDSSFPSGHVSSFVVIGGFLIFLTFTLCKPVMLRNLLVALFVCLIGLMAVARVYSGEHWPSDVGGSALLGSLWLIVTIFFYRWARERFASASSSLKRKNIVKGAAEDHAKAS